MSSPNEDKAIPPYRAPGDRTPIKGDAPVARKPFLRRRPPTVKPNPETVVAAPETAAPRFPEQQAPERPMTPHDLYLTYDYKGRLRTHTAYFAPPSTKPVKVIVGKKKKKEPAV